MFVYKEYSTAMSWNITWGNWRKFHTNIFSQQQQREAHRLHWFGDVVIKKKAPPQGDRQRERATKTDNLLRGGASQFSCSVRQDGEPTSAPIDKLYKLLRSEGAKQCSWLSHSFGRSWSHAHYTHCGCESLKHDYLYLIYNFICQVVFIWCTKSNFILVT